MHINSKHFLSIIQKKCIKRKLFKTNKRSAFDNIQVTTHSFSQDQVHRTA